MARIATICTDERKGTRQVDMAAIRWYRMSAELAALGHEVDLLHGRYKWFPVQPVRELAPRFREVPLARARPDDYDVVLTLFHRGFETAERFGFDDHPFVISKLGSVVADRDHPGIFFYGELRERLFATQERIDRRSRFVALISRPAVGLWRELHGGVAEPLLVPGAADAEIPARGADPFPQDGRRRVLFAGNFYSLEGGSQPEAHRVLADKLNTLAAGLRDEGIGVYVLGPGRSESLSVDVTYLGVAEYRESWQYLYWADVGLVVSAGAFMHNNESTKIYHYLRAGLPVVSESGFPNDDLITDARCGQLVTPGDPTALQGVVAEVLRRKWDRDSAIDFILRDHTWTRRAEIYDRVVRSSPGRTEGS
jgi:glycosyltransferase involved in cell wall biosynthesis